MITFLDNFAKGQVKTIKLGRRAGIIFWSETFMLYDSNMNEFEISRNNTTMISTDAKQLAISDLTVKKTIFVGNKVLLTGEIESKIDKVNLLSGHTYTFIEVDE